MIKRIFSFLLSIVAAFSGFAINEKDNVIEYADMPYGIRAKRQIFDLCIPKSVKGDANMVLYVHGGAWTEGSKDSYSDVLKSMAEQGVICAAINYRYCGKPNYASVYDVLDDITSALSKIKETAAENGINLKGVMLDGGSAGAHLSLLYAYSRVDEAPIKPVAVVGRSSVSDFTDMSIYDGSLHNLDPEKWYIPKSKWKEYFRSMINKPFMGDNFEKYYDELYDISPVKYVNENTVPTIISHGTMDTVLPYSGAAALDQKLTEYGVEHSFITYEGAWHGLEGCPEADAEMSKVYAEFLNKYVAS